MEVIDLISDAGDPVNTLEALFSDISVEESSQPVIQHGRRLGSRKRPPPPPDPVADSQEPLSDLVAQYKRPRRASVGPSIVQTDPDFVVEAALGSDSVSDVGLEGVPAVAVTQLLVMSIGLADIREFVGRSFGTRPPPAAENQNLFHRIESCSDRDLKFSGHLTSASALHGHCCYLRTQKKGQNPVIKLLELGANNDSPRTGLLGGAVGTKIYIYHILARHKAELAPRGGLTMDRLRLVSQDKRDKSPWTIVHLCGHKWCMNENHLDIKSKRYNDEQYSCHRGLQGAQSQYEYLGVQRDYCKHAEKCWTINYDGVFKDEFQWSAD